MDGEKKTMLPEFLDEHEKFKAGIEPISSLEEMEGLQVWLEKKELESSRQVRPAWIEVVLAIVALTQQRVAAEKGRDNIGLASFETHIVARQVAKQKNKRQVATRFVTDEIKRISKHQIGLIETCKDSEYVAVIGWFRHSDRRGLGVGKIRHSEALKLCNVSGAVSNQTEITECEPSKSISFHSVILPIVACLCGAAIMLVSQHLMYKSDSPLNTLDSIKRAKLMKCGVDGSLAHFSLRNDVEQIWWGLDVELCKALGAALDVDVDFVKVSSSKFESRIKALLDREVDILFRNTSHTVTRDLSSEIVFGPTYFYEQEIFLDLSSGSNARTLTLEEIKNKKVCVKPGSSNAAALKQLSADTPFSMITQNRLAEDLTDNVKLLRALRLEGSLCDWVFGNYFVLKQLKLDQEKRSPDKKIALRSLENISYDPLAPVLLRDYQWQRAVSHTIYALLYADKLGINSFNVKEKYKMGSELEKRFLQGYELEKSGLENGWVYRIISKIGNYSEVYYRSIYCDYVSCDLPSEQAFYDTMNAIREARWPNILFDERDLKPGLLQTPRF